jgi:membrane protein YdbS with pleckstrin-like domain
MNAAQDALLRFLRVPPQPAAPAGEPGSVRIFRAARAYFHYSLVRWGLKQAAALWGLVVGLGALQVMPEFPYDGWVRVAEVVGIGTFILQVPLTLVGVTLDFQMRWYIVTDRSLRIREGILKVQERTMSFANIQNLGVKQGPIQRLLGISDLEVKSAGGGETKKEAGEKQDDLHTGYFRGVDNAEEIKSLILTRLRRLRDSGLGDPEEAAHAELPPLPSAPAAAAVGEAAGVATPADGVLAAARQLLAEARRLGAAAR